MSDGNLNAAADALINIFIALICPEKSSPINNADDTEEMFDLYARKWFIAACRCT